MDTVSEVVAVASLLLVRLGIPLAVMVFITWSLRRLDARWQAEAAARQATAEVTAGRVPPVAYKAPQAVATPCWQLRNCSEATRARCAAAKDTVLPCWMARLRADGRLPGPCYSCALFRLRPRPEAVPQ
jgi:hypothetical protein